MKYMVMAFNATFNNISVISWRSVEETGAPDKNHIDLSQVTDKLDHIILYRIHFAVSLNRTHNSLIAQIVVNPTTIRS